MKVYVTSEHHAYWDKMSAYYQEDSFLIGCAKKPNDMARVLKSDCASQIDLIPVPDSDPRLGTFEV